MAGLYVLFDGNCNLCDGFVSFAMRRDRAERLSFVPLQSAEGIALLNEPEGQSMAFVENGQVWRASDAALRVFGYLDWPWSWLAWLRVFPRGLRDLVYGIVARLRYRLFGARAVCEITPRSRARRG